MYIHFVTIEIIKLQSIGVVMAPSSRCHCDLFISSFSSGSWFMIESDKNHSIKIGSLHFSIWLDAKNYRKSTFCLTDGVNDGEISDIRWFHGVTDLTGDAKPFSNHQLTEFINIYSIKTILSYFLFCKDFQFEDIYLDWWNILDNVEL